VTFGRLSALNPPPPKPNPTPLPPGVKVGVLQREREKYVFAEEDGKLTKSQKLHLGGEKTQIEYAEMGYLSPDGEALRKGKRGKKKTYT